jgi:hypothetical protein
VSKVFLVHLIVISVLFIPCRLCVVRLDRRHQDWIEKTIRQVLACSAAQRFRTTYQKSLHAIEASDPSSMLYCNIHNQLVRCEVTFCRQSRRCVIMTVRLYWIDSRETRFEQEQCWEVLPESMRTYLMQSPLPYTYEWYLPARIV